MQGEKKHGVRQRSTVSARQGEWHPVRVSGAAAQAVLLFSRSRAGAARQNHGQPVQAGPVRGASARRRQCGATGADAGHAAARVGADGAEDRRADALRCKPPAAI
jgi:hypothetical protein